MTERLLYLIRHAPVTLLADRPAPEWPLTQQGRALAQQLAGAPVWRSLALVASSPEGKALHTAEPIAAAAGLSVVVEQDLREVERPGTPVMDYQDYQAMVARFFDSLDQPIHDWESGRQAQQRVVSVVERLLRQSQGSLALASHGLLLSLYLAALSGSAKPDYDAWQAIPLPAVAVVDPLEGRLVAPFVSVEQFLEGFR